VALLRVVPDLTAAIKEAEPLTPPAPQMLCKSTVLQHWRRVVRADGEGLDPPCREIAASLVKLASLRIRTGRRGRHLTRRRSGSRDSRLFPLEGEQMPDEENKQSPERQHKQFDDAVEQGNLVATADSFRR
jgi:hypothetical protein